MTVDARHAAAVPARSRVGGWLFIIATLCGLWFGLTAPDVSPVTPGASTAVVGVPVPGPGVLP